jgi:sensor histidine kinase YesM
MKKYIEFFVHLLFWGILFTFFRYTKPNEYVASISFFLINVPFVYIHALWLVPAYVSKKRYIQYGFIVLAIIFGLSLIEAVIGISLNVYGPNSSLELPLKFLFATMVNIAIKLILFLPVSFFYLFIRDFIRNRNVSSYTEVEVAIHLFFWGNIWIGIFEKQPHGGIEHHPFNLIVLISYVSLFVLTNAVLFYGNVFWLIPAFLMKSKRLSYLLILALLTTLVICMDVAIIFIVQSLTDLNIYQNNFERNIFFKLVWILPLSFFYRFTKDWITHENVKQQLIGEKLSAELSFLKYQINPHFLFNTLNNLYALALVENSSSTADGVAKLGSLMRYMLHESDVHFIALHKEIAYIENFVELQKIRISTEHDIEIQFSVEGERQGFEIAPMMLIPFIENAFKHGISLRATSFINMHIQIFGTMLRMVVKNSLHQVKQKQEAKGLGLENVKRRLALIYPQSHTLDIKTESETFMVTLTLDLKKL